MDAQTLSDQTRVRLQAYEGRYAEIARRFPDLSQSWLSKFANGHKDNPTVGSLQSLIEALNALDQEAAGPEPHERNTDRRIDTPEAASRLLGVSRGAATPVVSDPPAEDLEPEVPGDSRVVPFEAPP